MMNMIDLAFKKGQIEKRPLLITYSVCGDPNKKKSVEILKSISEHVDLVEWGFAFNSPTADGPCLLYTSPSPRDLSTSRMPSSA